MLPVLRVQQEFGVLNICHRIINDQATKRTRDDLTSLCCQEQDEMKKISLSKLSLTFFKIIVRGCFIQNRAYTVAQRQLIRKTAFISFHCR